MSDKKLKVGELIAKLQKFDPEGEIEVAVNTNTQRYPSAYVPIISADFVSQQQFRVGSQSGFPSQVYMPHFGVVA